MTPFAKATQRFKELHASEPDGPYKEAVSDLVRELRSDIRLADHVGDARYRLPHLMALAGIDPESCEFCSGSRVFCGSPCDNCEENE